MILDTIDVNPTASPVASVIWLHGLGADGNDFVPLVSELALPMPVRFIFPHAPSIPVTINNGYIMRAWYDIASLSINERADEKGIAQSVAQINNLIAREEQLGIPSERIILAGFSQGAVMALTTGLSYSKRLAGILALSGYLPFEENIFFKQASAINQSLPIFLAHGTQDTIVPYFLGQAAKAILEKHDYLVSWHSYPMPHSVCAEEIHDIAAWLTTVLSK